MYLSFSPPAPFDSPKRHREEFETESPIRIFSSKIYLPWHPVSQHLVGFSIIGEPKVIAQPVHAPRHITAVVNVDVLVIDRAPHRLDEDVVESPTLVHADPDFPSGGCR